MAFCNRLSQWEELTSAYSILGKTVTWDPGASGYRLPTEAEWEYAARGGKEGRGFTYAGGNEAGSVAWYWINTGSSTHPVGTKAPNELGLYDMSGNVREWCWDKYGAYTAAADRDPQGAALGTDRVIRGGSWGSDAAYLRSACRFIPPADRNVSVGFRVVRPL